MGIVWHGDDKLSNASRKGDVLRPRGDGLQSLPALNSKQVIKHGSLNQNMELKRDKGVVP